jgi:hypothetical protein
MRMSKIWRWVAPLAMAGGLVAALGAVPAEAASAAAPTITIQAKNPAFPNVSGDTLVFYGVKQAQDAVVSGTVTGAAAGDVVTLLAKPFRAKHFAVTGKPVTLTSSTQGYSFTVRPTLATAYEAQVKTGSTVDATSAVHYVYVSLFVNPVSLRDKCNKADTECSLIITTRTVVPASAYHSESTKRWYLYLGLNRSHGVPSKKPPKYLLLERSASASKPVRIRATDFQITFTFPFATDRENVEQFADACTKNTETKDGIGLPGRHGCGDSKIPSSAIYLG